MSQRSKAKLCAFQFTLPCRERRPPPRPVNVKSSFNSRSRVGSDGVKPDVARDGRLFQFTLPCRERPPRAFPRLDSQSFNSRSRVGSDFKEWVKNGGKVEFQFTLPCRERRIPAEAGRSVGRFQFTLPCRERQKEVSEW